MDKIIKKIIFLVIIVLAVGFMLFELKLVNLNKFLTGSAKLSWNASDDASVAGYKIYYGTNPRNNDCPPGGYEKNIDAGKNTNYDLNNLEFGKTYYFSVTSYNSAKKESCFSEEMKKAVPSRISSFLQAIF